MSSFLLSSLLVSFLVFPYVAALVGIRNSTVALSDGSELPLPGSVRVALSVLFCLSVAFVELVTYLALSYITTP